jgi:hypothetical protein
MLAGPLGAAAGRRTMRNHVSAWLAAVGLAFAVQAAAQGQTAPAGTNPNPNAPGSGHDAFVSDANQREFTVTGTVVRDRGGKMAVRIDDHHHVIPFQVTGSAAGQDVRPGSRVAVTYHPTGETGQAIDQVQVLEQPRAARRNRGSDREPAKK